MRFRIWRNVFAAPVVEDGSRGRSEGDCREAFRLSERADFFWRRVRDWLEAEYGRDGCLPDRCWQRGLAYADARMHAVLFAGAVFHIISWKILRLRRFREAEISRIT